MKLGSDALQMAVAALFLRAIPFLLIYHPYGIENIHWTYSK